MTMMLSTLAGRMLAMDDARALPWLTRAARDPVQPERAVLLDGTERRGAALYDVTADGIALIPVSGILVHRLGWLDPWGWWLGYDVLRWLIETAIADPDVRAIALIIDSPGGDVAGCPELATWLATVSGGDTPVIAVVDAMAASAAYWIASATAAIALTPSGMVGSIGAVITHWDWSGMLAEFGIKAEHIHSGAHKVDGSPFRPLTDQARDAFQADVDRCRQVFAAAVAGNRGLDLDAVLATEAHMFDGLAVDGTPPALAAGLADTVAPAQEVLARLAADLDANPTT